MINYNVTTWFIFMLTITWSLSMVVETIEVQITGDFDSHADIHGGTMRGILPDGSTSGTFLEAAGCHHWMIACAVLPPATAMVEDFNCKHKNTTKIQLLTSNLR